jgi:hypothetical protein
LPYLNLGILEIINLKPDAYVPTTNITLVAGAVQNLPAGSIDLVDLVCNMGASGTVPGGIINSIDKTVMDHLIPDWITFPTAAEVKYAVFDSRNPKVFYVFPPQPDPPVQKVKAILSTPPDELMAADDIFPLDDSYRPAAVDYVVYRALAEETTVPNALAKSGQSWNKFLQDLGLKSQTEKQTQAKGE